jgi:hypothetical protein
MMTRTDRTATVATSTPAASTPATARKGFVVGTPFVKEVRLCSDCRTQKFLATEDRQTCCRNCTREALKAAHEARERREKAAKAAAAKKAREDGLKADFLANKPLPEGTNASVNGRQVIIKALDGLSITFKPKAD